LQPLDLKWNLLIQKSLCQKDQLLSLKNNSQIY
jgi:hypothetical protein